MDHNFPGTSCAAHTDLGPGGESGSVTFLYLFSFPCGVSVECHPPTLQPTPPLPTPTYNPFVTSY